MATAREIKRRIQSVENMGQVTKALQAVSASKAQKAQSAAKSTRAYARAAWDVITHVGFAAEGPLHPLLEPSTSWENVMIILVTGDRGLCGAYNHNILQTALDFVKDIGISAQYLTVGQRGRDLLWRMGEKIIAEFHDMPVVPNVVDIAPIARAAIDDFLAGEVDEVYLAYTDFVNMLNQNPVIQPLLPLCRSEGQGRSTMTCVMEPEPARVVQYLYEPDAPTILNRILPRFIELQVYQAVLEGHASEHAARMVAMRNATENANELAEDLTLDYNKARQRSITREILDIAGGAEALGQAQAASSA